MREVVPVCHGERLHSCSRAAPFPGHVREPQRKHSTAPEIVVIYPRTIRKQRETEREKEDRGDKNRNATRMRGDAAGHQKAKTSLADRIPETLQSVLETAPSRPQRRHLTPHYTQTDRQTQCQCPVLDDAIIHVVATPL